jgi:magnesium chelatase family protein
MEIVAYEPLGFEGSLVRVEVDIRRGIPAVDIVGLAAASVRESRDRVRVAIRNAGFEFPQDRVLINLSPADLPKEGSLYDLPIAARILAAAGIVPDCGEKLLVLGELTLDGHICPVRGSLPAILRAFNQGVRHFIIPLGNYHENARFSKGILHPARHLRDIPQIMIGIREGRVPAPPDEAPAPDSGNGRRHADSPDFSDYLGNESVVRALTIAAAGRHNMLLFGPPGAGKTMAAMRFPSLLPDLDEVQALEVAAIWSLRGFSYRENRGRHRPPVRVPHHSSSLEGIVGGGKPLLPGEISLAHRGLLVLDETPEFHRDVLQSLREPLEEGRISVVRAGRIIGYPADFQLLLAANSCPCGNLGHPSHSCLCQPVEVQRYWKRMGGPLIDRIDMRIPVPVQAINERLVPDKEKTLRLAGSIAAAVKIQRHRTRAEGPVFNGRLSPQQVLRFCRTDESGRVALALRAEEFGFSMRACHSILKLARTIADLAGDAMIHHDAIEEAVGYRQFGDGDCFWPF